MNKILNHKKILNNNVEMPQFGLGTYKMTNEEESLAAVKHALKIGYRHIDTAHIYKNHKIIANAIKESGVPRNEIFITSKIWITDFKEPEAAFDRILLELETDYIDLCLLHWFAPDWEKAYKLLEEKYLQKKVRAIGVSNFMVDQLQQLLKIAQVKPTVNQIELHPQLPCLEIVDFCNKNNIAITSWQTIMKGEVSKIGEIVEISEKYKVTPAQVALRWAWERGIIIIPKSVNNFRIEENCNIDNFKLSKEEIELINKLSPEVRLGPDPNNINEL
ncbi:aldo/keto reductase [Spiroplasma alleghenense]|uniref:Aldo/keto reductase n=1 Tax=Spiroplasma alleghenense TaxID=216931 RepID=A0A345Z4D0_9MOLU|nr:aldo/keto reductase [Spiroplasma alleghenense]AXK51459.1 aldo/keto reductase [Spiroplasma alleghenense]